MQSMEGMEGMESGVWNREHGSRSLEHGVCRAVSMDYGVWSYTEYGVWRVQYGGRNRALGLCSMEYRIWIMESGVWSLD